MFAGAEVVEGVDVADSDGIFRSDGHDVVATSFKIVTFFGGEIPIRRTEVLGTRTGECFDDLGSLVDVSEYPGFAFFLFCDAQVLVAEGMVLDLVTIFEQLLGGVDTSDANVGLVATFAPGLRSEAPTHHEESGLDLLTVEKCKQSGCGLRILGAEEDVGTRAVVEGEGNELFRGMQLGGKYKKDEYRRDASQCVHGVVITRMHRFAGRRNTTGGARPSFVTEC